jgi:hypothetical protein
MPMMDGWTHLRSLYIISQHDKTNAALKTNEHTLNMAQTERPIFEIGRVVRVTSSFRESESRQNKTEERTDDLRTGQ